MHILDVHAARWQIFQNRNNPQLDLRQRAAHEKRSRFDIPRQNDRTWRAEVETDSDVSGGQVVWQGDAWERTLQQMMRKRS